MRIDFGDRFVLDGDGHNLTLYEKRLIVGNGRGKEPKPENVGKEREVVLGYYGTLQGALKSLVSRLSLGDPTITTVEQLETQLAILLEAIDQLPQRFTDILRGIPEDDDGSV